MMEKATFFFFFFNSNENVPTADYRGHWGEKKNQFSFQRKAFVFALMQTGEIWQHI